MRSEDRQRYFEKPIARSLKLRAIKGGGASIAAEIVSLVVRIFGVVVLARLLQPRDFGLVTMVTAFYLLLLGFGYNGFTEYVIQKETITSRELSGIFWLHGLVSLCLSLLFLGAAPALAAFYKEPSATWVAMVMASGILAQVLSTHHLALLKRGMQFKHVATITVAARIGSVALAIVMALAGFRYWSIVARQLSEVFIMAFGAWIACPWMPSLPARPLKELKSLRFALPVYGNYALDYLSRQIDKILLGRFYGSMVLGNYDRASYLASIPVDQLVAPLGNVGLATLSRLRRDPAKFRRYYQKALCLLAFAGVYGSLLLTLSGKDLVLLLLGPGWEQAGRVVTALGPGIGARIIYSTYNWIHLSLAQPQRWLRWNIFSVVTTISALIAVVHLGAVALSVVISLLPYVLVLPALAYAGRPVELKMVPLVKAIGPYFAAGTIACLTWLGAEGFLPSVSHFLSKLAPAIRVLAVVVYCTAAYTILVVLFFRSLNPLRDLAVSLQTFVWRERSEELA